jgi:hypothetical protein
MQITKTADNEFRVQLTFDESRILINCMNTSLQEIMTSEFQTRTGSYPDEIKAISSAMEAALK